VLSSRASATLPVVAAAGGIVLPAGLYLAINLIGGGNPNGWASRSPPTSPSRWPSWDCSALVIARLAVLVASALAIPLAYAWLRTTLARG
jgi:Na+/H+ antiporter 1